MFMKKYLLTLVAGVLATVASAFTPTPDPDIYYYMIVDPEHGEIWYPVLTEPCPTGPVLDCRKPTPHGTQQIFFTPGGTALSRPI